MKIPLKTPAEIKIMAEGGQRLAAIVRSVGEAVKPGVTTGELERLAQRLIDEAGGQSSFKGFHGYPAVSCLSVNEEVVHGIPGLRVLKTGDTVGIDIGLRYQKFCTDHAITVPVGQIDQKTAQLLAVTEKALSIGLEQVIPGNHLGDISSAIQEAVEQHGFGIVRDLTGHGIGREPHEEPSIPNFGKKGMGPLIEEGMVLAIEPMVTIGNPQVQQLSDGWTIVTMDGSSAAHFEHTVAVTKNGCTILTQ